jgi:hypothetical protein
VDVVELWRLWSARWNTVVWEEAPWSRFDPPIRPGGYWVRQKERFLIDPVAVDIVGRFEDGHVRSSVNAERRLDAIRRRCERLAEGLNPDPGGFDSGFHDYGTLRCPQCGKVGGCRCRQGGAL